VQNDMSTALMWSKSKLGAEFQYGGRLGEFNGMSSQSHVSHCRVLQPERVFSQKVGGMGQKFNVVLIRTPYIYRPAI